MVSMADIAKTANVSRTTVSLVLNDRHIKGVNISEETRVRVKDAAFRLGYRTNKLALSVATGKSRVIGCIGLDRMDQPILSISSLLSGMVRAAAQRDYSIKMLPFDATLEELVDACVSYCLCGVIVRTRNLPFFEQFSAEMKKNKIPVVLVDSAFENPSVPSVVGDDYDGMRQVVEYLVSLGHSKLTYVTFEEYQPFSVRRKKGFLETAKRFGSRLTAVYCNTDNAQPIPVFERAEMIVRDIIQNGDLPDVFICNCDECAMVTLRAAWACGLKVPEDLSVTGFGNLPVDVLASPPLTSLALPYERIAEVSIELLLSGSTEPREIILPVSIQIRQSTAPKRALGNKTLISGNQNPFAGESK